MAAYGNDDRFDPSGAGHSAFPCTRVLLHACVATPGCRVFGLGDRILVCEHVTCCLSLPGNGNVPNREGRNTVPEYSDQALPDRADSA